MRIDEKYTPSTKAAAPTIPAVPATPAAPDALAALIAALPPASNPYAPAPAAKPAAKSRAIPAWMARQYKAGGHDVPVAAPTHDAPAWLAAEMPPATRAVQAKPRQFVTEPVGESRVPGFLNMISPRGPGV